MFSALLQQLKYGLEKSKAVKSFNPKDFRRLVFCGMGGSIMPAEAISMLWLKDCPWYLNRSPYLPHWVSNQDLIICTSWSGNTAETLAVYQEARQKKLPLLAIGNGGQLIAKAARDSIPQLNLEVNFIATRNAFGYLLAVTLTAISFGDIIEEALNSSLFQSTAASLELEDQAQRLAAVLNDRIPLFYTAYSWRFLGAFWKRFFNENGKKHAFANYLPEALHNEIAGLKARDEFAYWLLVEPESQNVDFERQQFSRFYRWLISQKASAEIIKIEGQNRLEKILQQYCLARLTSECWAQKKGIDPGDISIIENFKKIK